MISESTSTSKFHRKSKNVAKGPSMGTMSKTFYNFVVMFGFESRTMTEAAAIKEAQRLKHVEGENYYIKYFISFKAFPLMK